MRVMSWEIRAEKPGDVPAVREVNRLAFGREDETRLVDDLRNGTHARISLVARCENKIIGHVMFSALSIETERGSAEALAPVAVVPESVPQRQSLHVHQYPDLHFVSSPPLEHSQVAIAAGFSGHGYKFASMVGEILANLTIDGATR